MTNFWVASGRQFEEIRPDMCRGPFDTQDAAETARQEVLQQDGTLYTTIFATVESQLYPGVRCFFNEDPEYPGPVRDERAIALHRLDEATKMCRYTLDALGMTPEALDRLARITSTGSRRARIQIAALRAIRRLNEPGLAQTGKR